MEAKLQRRIQRYGWDKAADVYEAGWRDSLSDAQAMVLHVARARLGEEVLDVACGTGLVTFPLAETVGPSGQVYATDLSDNMVAKVRHFADQRADLRVSAFRADAEDLSEMSTASVDLATCAFGLMYVSDTLAALREMFRVIRPGGRAVIAVWGERAKCGWAEIFPIVDSRVKSEVCPLFFRLGTNKALSLEMTEAGFEDVRTLRLMSELPYADEGAAIDAAFVGGPVALAYDRFDAQMRADAHREYLDSIAGYVSDWGYRIPGEFVICFGHKPR